MTMATKPTLTLREIKNKVTGIDLMVPDYVEKAGRLSKSAVYNVIIITRLFYYKPKGLKESDVVQFTVQKTLEEFEHLHERLSARFPSVLFPTLPKKSIMGSSGLFQERRKVLDELMQFVARTQKLCCSPMLLEFLGVRKPERAAQTTITVTEKIFEEEKSEDVESVAPEGSTPEVKADTRTAGNEEQGDMFVPVDLDSSHLSDISAQEEVFSAANSRKLELHASLFEDEINTSSKPKDESDLFLPSDAHIEVQRKVLLDDNENADDLLNIDDDTDDLLALSKKSERKASIKASQSARPSVKPKPQPRTSFDGGPCDDDLSMLSSPAKQTGCVPEGKESDFFIEARTKGKASLRDKKLDTRKEDTLDDIFGKPSNSKDIFGKESGEDELFATSTTSASNGASELNQDDITKYINDNIGSSVADLGL